MLTCTKQIKRVYKASKDLEQMRSFNMNFKSQYLSACVVLRSALKLSGESIKRALQSKYVQDSVTAIAIGLVTAGVCCYSSLDGVAVFLLGVGPLREGLIKLLTKARAFVTRYAWLLFFVVPCIAFLLLTPVYREYLLPVAQTILDLFFRSKIGKVATEVPSGDDGVTQEKVCGEVEHKEEPSVSSESIATRAAAIEYEEEPLPPVPSEKSYDESEPAVAASPTAEGYTPKLSRQFEETWLSQPPKLRPSEAQARKEAREEEVTLRPGQIVGRVKTAGDFGPAGTPPRTSKPRSDLSVDPTGTGLCKLELTRAGYNRLDRHRDKTFKHLQPSQPAQPRTRVRGAIPKNTGREHPPVLNPDFEKTWLSHQPSGSAVVGSGATTPQTPEPAEESIEECKQGVSKK